jgi:chromosome segregation ATPase
MNDDDLELELNELKGRASEADGRHTVLCAEMVAVNAKLKCLSEQIRESDASLRDLKDGLEMLLRLNESLVRPCPPPRSN